METRGVMIVEEAGHRGFTDALQEVANRPIAEHVLAVLAASGIRDCLIIGAEKNLPVVLERLRDSEEAGQVQLHGIALSGRVDYATALRAAAPHAGPGPWIAHAANGLLGEPLSPFLDGLGRGGPDLTLFLQQGADSGHLNAASKELLHIAEIDPERDALGAAGVWIFGPGALQLAAASSWRTTPDVDFSELAQRITGNGGRFEAVPGAAWHSYTGASVDLLELNLLALDRLEGNLRRPYNHDNRIEGRVWIHESASVRSSVIVGPVVIAAGAHVSDAYIGPYTSIGTGAHVEGAEVERSIISPGARILHVGGRIISSVVGRNARVYRDFSLPRAVRMHVGDGNEVAFC